MTSTGYTREAAALQLLLPKLEGDGFQVFLQPSPTLLPAFLRQDPPYAIALKDNKKIAIHVLPTSGRTQARPWHPRELFSADPDWELRIVYAPPLSAEQIMPIPPRALITENLDRILAIFDASGPVAALLIGWSVFEAAARSVVPQQFERPQAPARLLRILAADGYVTPDEAEMLRRVGNIRNAAAHGRHDIDLTREDVQAEDLQAEDLQAEDLQAEDLQAEDLQAEDLQALVDITRILLDLADHP